MALLRKLGVLVFVLLFGSRKRCPKHLFGGGGSSLSYNVLILGWLEDALLFHVSGDTNNLIHDLPSVIAFVGDIITVIINALFCAWKLCSACIVLFPFGSFSSDRDCR